MKCFLCGFARQRRLKQVLPPLGQARFDAVGAFFEYAERPAEIFFQIPAQIISFNRAERSREIERLAFNFARTVGGFIDQRSGRSSARLAVKGFDFGVTEFDDEFGYGNGGGFFRRLRVIGELFAEGCENLR